MEKYEKVHNDDEINIVQEKNEEYENNEMNFVNASLLRINDEGEMVLLEFKFLQKNKNWPVAFTSQFNKSLSRHNDKNLKKRVLEAIQKIAENPLTEVGDTIKPLTKHLEGKWRYRIGDFRIVYEPIISEKKVMLIDIDARGNIYE